MYLTHKKLKFQRSLFIFNKFMLSLLVIEHDIMQYQIISHHQKMPYNMTKSNIVEIILHKPQFETIKYYDVLLMWAFMDIPQYCMFKVIVNFVLQTICEAGHKAQLLNILQSIMEIRFGYDND